MGVTMSNAIQPGGGLTSGYSMIRQDENDYDNSSLDSLSVSDDGNAISTYVFGGFHPQECTAIMVSVVIIISGEKIFLSFRKNTRSVNWITHGRSRRE